jgi:hypothetical protein
VLAARWPPTSPGLGEDMHDTTVAGAWQGGIDGGGRPSLGHLA